MALRLDLPRARTGLYWVREHIIDLRRNAAANAEMRNGNLASVNNG